MTSQFTARFFDGKKSKAIEALVEVHAQGLKISFEEDNIERSYDWPKASLQLMERPFQEKPAVIGSKTMLGARLVISNYSDFEQVLPLIKSKYIKLSHVHHPWRIAWLLVLASIVIVFLSSWEFHQSALWLVRYIPQSWEDVVWEKYVETSLENYNQCVGTAGVKSLDKIVKKLAPKEVAERFDVRVVYTPEVSNAIALPGYHIVIFSGILNDIEDPDEFAFVLVHEMGHAYYRHVMALLLEYYGLEAYFKKVIGLSSTDVVSDLLGLKYQRDVEKQADDFAIDRLNQQNIDPTRFIHLLEKWQTSFEPKGFEEYLTDHPSHQERIKNISEKSYLQHTTPSLTTEEWNALRTICTKKIPLRYK